MLFIAMGRSLEGEFAKARRQSGVSNAGKYEESEWENELKEPTRRQNSFERERERSRRR